MLDPLSGASFFAENRVHLSARCAELCRLVRLKLRGLQENLPFLVVAPALPQWNCRRSGSRRSGHRSANTMDDPSSSPGLRRVVAIVAALNLGYFGIEFAVALAIGSVSLFADSVDFLEDASINLLIFAALGWGPRMRARVGMVLAGIILVPGLATLWTAWSKFWVPVAPDPVPLTLAGAGALAVNLACAYLLARYRHHGGSLTKAAFLSARNDAVANVAIVGAGLVTALTVSAWPDLIVGLAIAAMNADAAREVWKAAREEHRAETPSA
jgi:Co/Zn/Cd efflux system component